MSRRRVSVKDLGAVDCQGWLHRKREGRNFLRSKWKKYWFVLQKSSLYWYIDKMAQKAEGFINVSGFTVHPSKQRKHAITATHPLVVTIVMAAETFMDMNKIRFHPLDPVFPCRLVVAAAVVVILPSIAVLLLLWDPRHVIHSQWWINKLSEAAEACEDVTSEDPYSEDSDQDCVSTSSSDHETADCENLLHESCSPLPPSTVPTETDGDGGATSFPQIPMGEDGEDEQVHEKTQDEMEKLYQDLKAARLTLVGRSSRRDFRASFIRRCQNDQVNEKLHLLRILRSTLKAKQLELMEVEQILNDPDLTAPTYRKWRQSNLMLLQSISQQSRAAEGATGPAPDWSQSLTGSILVPSGAAGSQ